MIKIIDKILKDPRVYSESETKELASELVEQFAKTGMSYHSAHKLLEAHMEVFSEAFAMLGHNAMYELDKHPITFKLN